MREIKFRAWHLDGKMLTASSGREIGRLIDMGESVTLMQFTGLKDRNGVDIYEGDIISKEYPKAMRFNESKAAFVAINLPIQKIDYVDPEMRIDQQWIVEFDAEVIGNIYEHPDLLTATAD